MARHSEIREIPSGSGHFIHIDRFGEDAAPPTSSTDLGWMGLISLTLISILVGGVVGSMMTYEELKYHPVRRR